MHLSTGFPGVRMRKEEYGQSDHTKADPSIKEELEENSRSKSAKLRVFERAGKEE